MESFFSLQKRLGKILADTETLRMQSEQAIKEYHELEESFNSADSPDTQVEILVKQGELFARRIKLNHSYISMTMERRNVEFAINRALSDPF